MKPIKFGTDGWRGVIADDYTLDNLARVAAATASYLKLEDRKELQIYSEWNTPYRSAEDGVIIGYDTRFMSEKFALHVGRVLESSGVPAAVSTEPVPTPAVSLGVRNRGAAAGIMITASHNPPEYNGFKFKCEFAASAPPLVTDRIEELLPEEPPEYDRTGSVRRIDLASSYVDAVADLIDGDRLAQSPAIAVVDAMYGSAQGFAERVLKRFDTPVVPIRNENNPGFRGIRPEPLEEYLEPLKVAVREQSRKTGRLTVGVVTDGDGDRISAMTEDGTFIDAHRTYALLLRHLVEDRGWGGKVVKNFPLTDLVFEIGSRNDLEVDETPVGFKFIAEKMIREDVLIGGEESGGIGIKNHIPERDGILCGLLLLEMVAERGVPISSLIEETMEKYGYHYYHRRDIELEARKEVVDKMTSAPPSEIDAFHVEKVETTDGVKLRFEDGWLLLRPSGTEPLLRIYCEMDRMEKVDRVLESAESYARDLAG
ncbi:MAG: phosphoglucomutase/phosphomannomutase family protein [Candidatus Acetothermia bacterium]